MTPAESAKPGPVGQSAGPGSRLREEDFRYLADLIYRHFGIHLTEQKRSLVVGRLQKVVRERGFTDFQAYCQHLKTNGPDADLDELVNRISTNHTFFFREPAHFEFLTQTVLPQMRERHASDRDMRIWSAASSSGEEPYSVAMTLMEAFGAEYHQWDAGVLATDISARALAMARRGVYREEQLKNISPALRRRYFQAGDEPGLWRVGEALRREVTFRRFNLMNERFPFQRPFDLILCRNVMIYFDPPTRERLVRRFIDSLVPGGYLFIGHSESISRTETGLQFVQPAIYRKGG